MKKCYPLLVSLLLLFHVNLSAQKVAVCGISSSAPDAFSFVALVNLTVTDIIYFTDGPYVASNNSFNVSNTDDALMRYNPPVGGITAGDVVVITEGSANSFIYSRTGGAAPGTITLSNGNFDLSNREPIFSFETSNPAFPATNIAELYGRTVIGGMGGANDGDDPGADANLNRSPNYASIVFPAGGGGGASTNVEFNPALRNGSVGVAAFTATTNWSISNATFALSTTPFTNLTFPVEWLSFEARIQGTQVQLEWATASELNNDFFAIERSLDGQRYAEIGKIQGAGTSQEVQQYAFADATPGFGANYYRLRQVDFDGAFDFSEVVRVELTAGNSMQLYPNPVTDQLQVRSGAGTLRLYTLTGQQLLEQKLEDGITQIDLSALKPGIYFAEIFAYTQGRTTHRIVK